MTISRIDTGERRNGRAVIRYKVRWREGGRGSKAHSRTFDTLADAKLFEQRRQTGEPVPPSPRSSAGGSTYGQAVEIYTATRKVSRGRQSTERSYAKRLAPLADRVIDDTAPSDIKGFVVALQSEVAPGTISGILRLLRSAVDLAVEDGTAIRNPAARVRGPKVKQRPMDSPDIVSPSEVKAIIDAAPRRWRALIAVGGFMGGRWSECIGLQAQDIDMLRRTITFGRVVIEEVDGLQEVRRGAKTDGSTGRTVPMTEIVYQLLAERFAAFPVAASGFIFTGEDDGNPYRSSWRQRVWLPAVQAAGLDGRGVTFRSLRPSAASAALAAGMPQPEIARRFGWESLRMLAVIYGRALPGDDTATAQLDAFISGSIG